MAGVLSLNGTFTYPIEILKTLTVDEKSSFKQSVAIGNSSTTDGVICLALGNSAVAAGSSSVSLGDGSTTGSNASNSFAIGKNSVANNANSIALGITSKAEHDRSFVWSGIEVSEAGVKKSTVSDGSFCIYPSNGVDGMFINGTSLTNVISSISIRSVSSNNNTFTGTNRFTNAITANGGLSVTGGTFTTADNASVEINGDTSVPDSSSSDSSNRIANTRFVKDNISKCVMLEGSTMSGKLTLSGDPIEPMHAATKQYVDNNSDKVTVDNSAQLNGRELAKVKVVSSSGTKETTIKTPTIIAGQNTSVVEDYSAGTIRISCNPEISVAGGTIKVPVGTIIPYAGNETPSGFLLCDGHAVSRTTYAELFSAIGTTFGTGDGSTTFNIPKLTDNRFIEGSSSNGTYRDAGLPNIKGQFAVTEEQSLGSVHFWSCDNNRTTGAFYGEKVDGTYGLDSTNGGGTGIITKFSASRCSNVYKDSISTVQPKSLTLRYFIKYTQTTEEKYVRSVNETYPDANGNVSISIPKMFPDPTDVSQVEFDVTRHFGSIFTCPKDCYLRVHRDSPGEWCKSIAVLFRKSSTDNFVTIAVGDSNGYQSTEYLVPMKRGWEWKIDISLLEPYETTPAISIYYYGLC